MAPTATVEQRAEQGRLGNFGSAFTPSVLTILGIILFLRLGFVVSSAGLMKALVIIAIANGVSVLTSISLSTVATNLKVMGGGDYYLIPRTLGVEFPRERFVAFRLTIPGQQFKSKVNIC